MRIYSANVKEQRFTALTQKLQQWEATWWNEQMPFTNCYLHVGFDAENDSMEMGFEPIICIQSNFEIFDQKLSQG